MALLSDVRLALRGWRRAPVFTLIAIGSGLPAAWWLSRYVSAQLYGVQATDPVTVFAAVLLLATVAILAGLIPSARAARVSPTTALRYE